VTWSAKGMLFENCNCTAVCPGHVHFSQPCTHEVCHGFWAIRFREGEVDGVRLDGLDVVVVYESPQVMIDGGWRQVLLVSDGATEEQRAAVEAVLDGSLGGPWEVLGRFVEERLPTRSVPIRIEEEPLVKRISIPGLLESAVSAIRGRDRGEPVTFENIYNQIHDPHQVIARGDTRFDDGTIVIATEGTHGLWSNFDWSP
jgi:hypothetical protein